MERGRRRKRERRGEERKWPAVACSISTQKGGGMRKRRKKSSWSSQGDRGPSKHLVKKVLPKEVPPVKSIFQRTQQNNKWNPPWRYCPPKKSYYKKRSPSQEQETSQPLRGSRYDHRIHLQEKKKKIIKKILKCPFPRINIFPLSLLNEKSRRMDKDTVYHTVHNVTRRGIGICVCVCACV